MLKLHWVDRFNDRSNQMYGVTFDEGIFSKGRWIDAAIYRVGDISILDELSGDEEYNEVVDFSLAVVYLIQKGSINNGARISRSADGARLALDSSVVIPICSENPGKTVLLIARLNFASNSSICARL